MSTLTKNARVETPHGIGVVCSIADDLVDVLHDDLVGELYNVADLRLVAAAPDPSATPDSARIGDLVASRAGWRADPRIVAHRATYLVYDESVAPGRRHSRGRLVATISESDEGFTPTRVNRVRPLDSAPTLDDALAIVAREVVR